MHRTNPVPRHIRSWSLLLALFLHTGIQAVSAQDSQSVRVQPAPIVDRPTDTAVITMTVGTAQTYQMASKENLRKVENPNPKVLNVQRVAGKFNEVLFEAVGLGRTRVTLVDQKDRIEYVEVVVVSDLVKELRDMIQRAVPTASVTVTASDGGKTLVLTGTVQSIDDGRVVQQVAGQLFGPNVINNIRIGGVQQVQLEVLVATVNRSALRNMSFSWVANGKNFFVSSIIPVGTAFNFTNSLATAPGNTASALSGPGSANIPFGILTDKGSFQGFLQALRTEGLTKTLAEPRIMTLSGRPANIVSGGEVPILTSSGLGAPSVSYKKFGTIVNFLPIVMGDGKIHMEIRPEISIPDAALGIAIAGATPTSITGFKTQSAEVSVRMEDGQTLAIGGLIQNDIVATITRIPVLGDLPFLGMAFTSKSYQETEQELIILVTPRLVDPVDCTKIPKYLPGRETRSPDDFEFFMEGIMEAPRGQRNIAVLHPFEYKAAYLSGPTASQWPCNDATGCGRNCGNGGNCNNGTCATGTCAAPSAASLGSFSTTPQAAPNNAVRTAPTNANPVNATPTSNRVTTAPSAPNAANTPPQPTVIPPARTAPGLGPVIPITPSRESESRPVLPPASFGPPTGN